MLTLEDLLNETGIQVIQEQVNELCAQKLWKKAALH